MKTLFVILLFVYTSFADAQSIYFGLRNEINFISTKRSNAYEIAIHPASFYGVIGTNLFKEINFEMRAGYIWGINVDYAGPEIGFYVKPHIITKTLYLLGGINFHINIPDNPDNISHTISLLGIGVGSNFYKAFVVELSFYQPLNKNYIFYSPVNDAPSLESIVKFSLGFNIP